MARKKKFNLKKTIIFLKDLSWMPAKFLVMIWDQGVWGKTLVKGIGILVLWFILCRYLVIQEQQKDYLRQQLQYTQQMHELKELQVKELESSTGATLQQKQDAEKENEALKKEIERLKKQVSKPLIRSVFAQEEPKRSTNQQVEEKVKMATIQAFGEEHWLAMHGLVMRESGFNPLAWNKSSGAAGLFQALPASKMGCEDWRNVDCQIAFGIRYIRERYGNPTNALQHWLNRVPINGRDYGHWY